MNIDETRMLDFGETIDLITFRCNTKYPHCPGFCPIIAQDEWNT